MATKRPLPRKRLTTVEAIQKHFRLDKPNPAEVSALGLSTAERDADDIFALLLKAVADGTARKYGPDPLTHPDFLDEAAIDCEAIETLLLLPEHSVRDYYLLEYRLARRNTPSVNISDVLARASQQDPSVGVVASPTAQSAPA
jgi:hypothetical protein